jgi:hypothetical protein
MVVTSVDSLFARCGGALTFGTVTFAVVLMTFGQALSLPFWNQKACIALYSYPIAAASASVG